MGQYQNIDADTLEQLQRFERTMRERRYSKSTIDTYMSMLKQFFGFFAPRKWSELNQEDVVTYNYETYIRPERSHSTQNQAINAIKLFYRVNGDAGIVPEDIQRPRKERKLPNVLSKEEVQSIIQSTKNLKHRTLLPWSYMVQVCALARRSTWN